MAKRNKPIAGKRKYNRYVEIAVRVTRGELAMHGQPGLGLRRRDMVEEVYLGLMRALDIKMRHEVDLDAYWKFANAITTQALDALRNNEAYKHRIGDQVFDGVYVIKERTGDGPLVNHYYLVQDLTREQLESPKEERRVQRVVDATKAAQVEAQMDWLYDEMGRQGVHRVGDLK